MNTVYKYSFVILATLCLSVVLLFSCKKEDPITGVMAQETYVNATGHDMTIRRFMKDQQQKSYTIKKDDTLKLENSIDAGADSTNMLFRADSALVTFDDNKAYAVRDTTTTISNFLKLVKHTISPSGKIHYYRYTFSTSEYEQAK